jgi:hypothetical protein
LTARARIAGAVAAVGLVAAVVVAAARKVGDFDLGWHLALGRLVATTHALPLHDSLSYTFAGQRAPDELLADTLLYFAARLGDGLGLQLVGAVAIALVAWLLVARARPAPWPVGVAFAALGLMAAGPWLVVRPALLSFVCLAANALVIDEQRRSGRGLWRLVPLQLLWSNLHGFAVFGPLFALAFAGDALLFRRPGARRTAAIAVAVVVVACLSPLGWRLYIDPFIVVYHQPLITEWTRTSFGFVVRYDLPLLVLGLALGAALVRERPEPYDVLVALVALALSLMAVRMIALGAILAAPLAARRLAPALERARGSALLLALLGLVAAPVIAATPDTRFGRGFDHANLPEGAVRFIAAQRPTGAAWNFLPFGGWLAWRLGPDVRVFIDGRTGRLYSVDFLERYFTAEHDARAFSAFVAAYDLQWAIVRSRPGEVFGEPIARDPRWTMVYLDDCAAVYVRKDGPNRALAAEGYTLLRHLTQPPRSRVAPALLPALRHDAALAVAQDPLSRRARALAAAAGL